MNLPLVSVIIPCFNSADFIAETLTSVVNQTYNNIEIIIVDDHSTDNSLAVINEFQEKNSFIFFYENSCKGSNAARIFGFEQSKGTYLLFLDSDDLISADYVSEKVSCFQKNGHNKVITSEWRLFREKILDSWNLSNRINKSYDSGRLLIYDMARYWQYSQVSAWMISRDLYIKSGGWDPLIMRNQDGELFFRLLLESDGVVFTHKAISYYRQRDGSLASKWSESNYRSFLKSIDSYNKNLISRHSTKMDKKAIVLFYSNVLYLISWGKYNTLASEIRKKIKVFGMSPRFGRSPMFTLLSRMFGFDNLCYVINIIKKKNV